MKNTYIKRVLFVLCLVSVSFVSSQDTASFFTKSDAFFKTNIVDGKVNYKKIKASTSQLNELIALSAGIVVSKNDADVYRAFWINAYNIAVIKSVVDKYPIKSPLDLGGFFDKKKHKISGVSITLNDIENKLLRAQFNNDPRFHFVLVCAGLGCPPIINKAYFPDTIEKQLDKQTSIALNNTSFIKVTDKKKKVLFSQIFEWYTTDFTAKKKTLIDFVNLYRAEKIPVKYKTGYYSYNWSLNDTK